LLATAEKTLRTAGLPNTSGEFDLLDILSAPLYRLSRYLIKANPTERRGRKITDLKGYNPMMAGLPDTMLVFQLAA
jgi:hypothetical protein